MPAPKSDETHRGTGGRNEKAHRTVDAVTYRLGVSQARLRTVVEVGPSKTRAGRQVAIGDCRLRVLQDEVHHPFAEQAEAGRIAIQLDSVEPAEDALEHALGQPVTNRTPRRELVQGKYHIHAAYRLLQHGRQKSDVVRQGVKNGYKITKRILQSDPGCGVEIDFLRQGIDLQRSEGWADHVRQSAT